MTEPEDTDAPSLEPFAERTSGVLTALEGADMGIFVLGPDFAVEWVNETAEEYFGLSRETVVGEDKQALIESTIQSIFARPERFAETVVDTYEDNTYVEEFECHVLAGEGRAERWLLHQSRPIEQGELAGGRVEHYTDITERKEREQALKRERDRLDEFAGVVSHDLRNPLNVASARLELAREECDSTNLAPVGDALDRMERIVTDVLWLAREGRDIGDTERVDLRELAESAWHLVAGDAVESDLVYTAGGRDSIEADPDRLRQLLENVFRNAVEHGSTSPAAGGQQDAVDDGGSGVTVRVESTDDGFAIEDDGPGIPPERRDRVFEAGYSSSAEGTGFGLRIVQQVVDAHGWTVSVTEGSEGGARFEVTGVEPAET